MVTWDVLYDRNNNLCDYFEVVGVRQNGETISTEFGRVGNPTPGTSGRCHDMDWYDGGSGEYRFAQINLGPIVTGTIRAVAIRFTVVNSDVGDEPFYDWYNTYVILDEIYLSCEPR
jgi:hypothetical protein